MSKKLQHNRPAQSAGQSKGKLKKPSNERCFKLNNHRPSNPIQVLNLHGIFRYFVCVLQMILLTCIAKIKSMLVLVPTAKTGSILGIKQAPQSNPKVNIGCHPLTANRISVNCEEISLEPSVQHIPLGLPYWGFNAINDYCCLNTIILSKLESPVAVG